MAISELGIVNSALIKLGVETISALPGTSRQGIMAEEQFDKIRDELLFDHPWNFAIKRASLVATVTVPAFEFAYEYTLPTDILRMIATEYGDDFYQIENNKLYSNYSTVKIRYISKITDPTSFTPSFAELLSSKLAADLCWPLTQSGTLKAALMEEYKTKLKDSRSFDGQENPSYPLTDDIFINSRY
jgi:hypothetical protein